MLWCDVPSASNSVAKAHQQLLEVAGLSIFAVSFLENTDGGQGQDNKQNCLVLGVFLSVGGISILKNNDALMSALD